jgi:hypothetical protein
MMSDDFVLKADDYRLIQNDFRSVLRKRLQRLLKGFIFLTRSNDKFGQMLDTRARVDATLLHPEYGRCGIGIHMQYGMGNRAFTIRNDQEFQEKTEFANDAKSADATFRAKIAKYIVHAYIDNTTGGLLCAAVAFTRDIYDCIDKGLCDIQVTDTELDDQTTDYLVNWDTLRNNGMWIYEFQQKRGHYDKDE